MSRIKNRLESRRGASITFALLLFLVCAVLSSVILVAATTAAGRIAGMVEADQRYYAVTSASELLKELISEKTVTVAEVTTASTTNSYTDGSPSASVSNNDEESVIYVVNGSADGMSAEELDDLSNATKNPGLSNKLSTIVEDAGYRYYEAKANPAALFPLTSTFTLSSTDAASVAVSITELIQADGSLVLTLSKDSFQQQLVFSCTVSDTSSSGSYNEVTGSSVTTQNQVQSEVKTNTTTVTTKKMTWTLTGVNSIGGGT